MKTKWIVPIAVSAGLLAAACGADSPGPGSGSGSSGNGSSEAAPIIVKGVAQLTAYPGVTAGFDARIARFNQAGGVDGHKIKSLGIVDDGGNASTNLTQVQAMVQNSNVFAVAPVLTNGFQAPSSTFLNQNHTIYVGDTFTGNWCNNDWGFGIQGCLIPTNGEASTELSGQIIQYEKKYAGLSPSQIRYAQIALDIPSSTASNAYVAAAMKASGVTNIVYDEAPIPANGSATNYTPYVEAVAATHPTIVDLLVDPATDIAFSAAWNAAGKPGVLYSPSVYNESILKQPNVVQALQGQIVNTQTPAEENNSPAIQQMRKDLEAIGKLQPIGQDVSDGYWSADMLIGLLENDAKHHVPFTSEATEALANKGWAYSSGIKGGNGSQTFPKAHVVGIVCGTLLQVKGNAYRLLLPYQCYPNIKL